MSKEKLTTFETDRYRVVCLDRKKKVLEHVYVWEQANGPKPAGCDIHHIDGNGKNNALENLVCLTKSEHKLLHARAKLAGKDIVDGTDPRIIKNRAENNARTKAHRQAHLEEERAKDREEYRRNRERKKERNREFYERHREEILADKKEYWETHKAECSARYAKFYAEHKEERAAYNKKFREANKEQLAAKKREYNQQHQDQIRAYRQTYKQVHAVNERYRRAVRNNAPEEVIAKLKDELEQAKELFRQQKEGMK